MKKIFVLCAALLVLLLGVTAPTGVALADVGNVHACDDLPLRPFPYD